MAEVKRVRRPKARHGYTTRASLAQVDCLTLESFADKANRALRDGELSLALDHLAEAERAIRRARKMIRTGR